MRRLEFWWTRQPVSYWQGLKPETLPCVKIGEIRNNSNLKTCLKGLLQSISHSALSSFLMLWSRKFFLMSSSLVISSMSSTYTCKINGEKDSKPSTIWKKDFSTILLFINIFGVIKYWQILLVDISCSPIWFTIYNIQYFWCTWTPWKTRLSLSLLGSDLEVFLRSVSLPWDSRCER